MTKTTVGRPRYELCGGHPALDFVNSLDNRFRADGPIELLADYEDLLRFAEQTGLLDAPRARRLASTANPAAAARALRSARGLRESLAAALYGGLDNHPPAPAHIRTLERYFHSASAHRELRWEQLGKHPNGRPSLDWNWGRFETNAELPVWLLSRAAGELMMSEAMGRIRACGAETCRWLFLDTSKNHTRRWCNMKVCGNRMKARRFQARRED
ncbi:MAG TPA: CGNR zinc finger domain-containing protein [Steroidobacteraceae bacterium]|jgi:predicted RNA-binding Zn ribbon-like protein|nr:CGNR zinc finger domain-containing protein [Steroidobacteraceae bacterium]